MALYALHGGVEAGQRERRVVVIEGRGGPVSRGVALRAIGWEAGSNVRRVGGSSKVGLVAPIASRGQRAGIVIVGVAACARHSYMGAGQRERCVVVIERRPRPVCRGVALRAIRWEITRHVRRVIRTREISLVASVACGRQRTVVAGCRGMALRALHGRMEAGQWERCRVVVKGRRRPSGRRVAESAVGRECRSDVVRIRSGGEVALVTCVAISRRRRVVIVRVALRARNRRVLTRQRVMRVQGVVKQRVVPVGCVVARTAIVWQSKRHVGRIVAVGEIRRVAGIALGRSSGEDIIDVACRALQRRVRTGQRITGVLQMVELRAHKVIHAVAGFARGGEVERHVIDDRRQEVLLMTRVASGR